MFKEALTFADVLLVPQYSEITSRSEVDLSVELPKGIKVKLPFIPANMKDIIGKEMIISIYKAGCMSLLHRFSSIEDQVSLLKELKKEFGNNIFNLTGISVGVKEEDKTNLKSFVELGIKIICIDIAHLDCKLGLDMVKYISNTYPSILLIAGNVATKEAAARAWKAGADIIKCGIGAGSICSTRTETAAGVPQLSAIMDIQSVRYSLGKELGRKLYFISDGGHSISADCVKALCYADLVMLGSMFSGCSETPSEIIEIDGQKLKTYSGSSTHKKNRIEGIKSVVNIKGSVIDILKQLSEGLQSGCSYQNSKNLQELKDNPQFIRITNSGIKESGIHDIHTIIK